MKESMVILMVCLLLSWVTAEGSDDWPVFQHDAQHSGHSSSSMPESLRVMWVKESPAKGCGPGLFIIVSGEKLFAANVENLSVLDVNTGSVVWSYSPSLVSLRFPAVGNNKVYLNQDMEIVCLDADTGEELWSHFIELLSFSSYPVVIDGNIVTGGGYTYEDLPLGEWTPENIERIERARHLACRVMCLEGGTGEILREFYTADFAVYSPAYLDGKIYVNNGSYVYCLNAQTGEQIWKKDIEWVSTSSLSLDQRRIFIGTGQGIVCCDRESGETSWKFECRNDICSTPVAAYNRVFVSLDSAFYCLNAETGKQIWNMEVESPIY